MEALSRGILSEAQIPLVDSFAPNLPISSEHIAPFPHPPAIRTTPGEYSSMYGATFPGV